MVATLRGDARRDLLPTIAITSVWVACVEELPLHTAQRLPAFDSLADPGWYVDFRISGPVSILKLRRVRAKRSEPYYSAFWLACALVSGMLLLAISVQALGSW